MSAGTEPPLCVDLDGAVLRTDMLFETLVAALRRDPLLALRLPLWLAQGRARLKRELAARAPIAPASLPYDEAVLEALRRERIAGRRVVLATASDERVAQAIAAHLGLFDEVLASDGRLNLKAAAKAQRLAERYGERGFDYMGHGAADVPVWRRARAAYVLGRDAAIVRSAQRAGAEVRPVDSRRSGAWPLVRALRVHQWAKNLLVFVPMLTAHRLGDAQAAASTLLAFAAFSFAASATYIFNDLADLEHDRVHPYKRRRALAAGDLPVWVGMVLAPQLFVLAFVVAIPLPAPFLLELACYCAATLAYSVWLKRVVLVDVFTLAGLYTVRILAGAAAISVPVSSWLLLFSLFLFLSLALAKRHAELARAGAARVAGRGYTGADRSLVGLFGVSAGQVSILVFALYLASPEVAALYRRPALLWIAAPLLLYWIARIWLFAYRDRLDDDPLVFALRDRASIACAIGVLLVVLAAT
jgi:4-hydroxybenzoate polyprenyltransferase